MKTPFAFKDLFRHSLLPILAALFPVIFHFVTNIEIVSTFSFLQLVGVMASGGLGVYLIAILFTRGKFSNASLIATIVIIGFYLFGFVFEFLRRVDLFPVELYNFMPFFLFMLIYIGWLVAKIKTDIVSKLNSVFLIMFSFLVVYNGVRAVLLLQQISAYMSDKQFTSMQATTDLKITGERPDVYYLLFDEAASFKVATDYFKIPEAASTMEYLEDNGFFVAQSSHGSSIYTLHELASRMNFLNYPVDEKNYSSYDQAIKVNQVVTTFKEQGYEVIAFDQRRSKFSGFSEFPADILVESPSKLQGKGFVFLDDFKMMVLEKTLIGPWLNPDPAIQDHRNMLLSTVENVTKTGNSPKFVFTHLMIPHEPFAFDASGAVLPPSVGYRNWQNYARNYQFFLVILREITENILNATNGSAVIVLQSDHGARNLTDQAYSGNFENYPKEYKTSIVNAFYLPGCENPPLTDDMDPINTFPIIFNCYFDADLPIQ